MPWQAAIIISVILYSCSTLLQRHLLRDAKANPITVSVFFQFVTGCIIAALGVILGQFRPFSLSALWPHLLILGVLYGIGNICIFRSLAAMEASRFTIMFASRAIVTIVASWLMLNERLTGWQLAGALCIFVSIVIVHSREARLQIKGKELLALGAAACFGLANTNDRLLLTQLNVFTYIVLAFYLPVAVTALLRPRETLAAPQLLRTRQLPGLLLLCVFYTGSALSFFTALQTAPNSAQVATINLTSVILIVLLSAVLLRERADLGKKIAAAVLTFVGLLLVG